MFMKVHAYSNYFAFFVYGEETRYIEAFGFLPNVLPSYFMANGTVYLDSILSIKGTERYWLLSFSVWVIL